MNRSTSQRAWLFPLLTLAFLGCTGDWNPPGSGTPSNRGKVIAVSAGSAHSLALMDNGTVMAWGSNAAGSLGDGTGQDSLVPVQVMGLTAVKQVSAGHSHALALTNAGEVWAWGDNARGQLGVAASGSSKLPVRLELASVVAVVASGDASFAIDADGVVWGWGNNESGQLGDGTTMNRDSPTLLTGLSTVRITHLAASPHAVLAQDADGHVWGWGLRTAYVLGTGEWEGRQLEPIQVTSLDAFGIGQLAMGVSHSLALLNDQTLVGWGGNHGGELGLEPKSPPTVKAPTAFSNPGLTSLAQVAGGNGLSLAVTHAGEVFTWGSNTYGQLGDGVLDANRHLPTLLTDAAGATVLGVLTVSASQSNGHVLALRTDGSVFSWGANAYGQLGDGSLTARDRPVLVVGLN